jgi:hypothetical protein
VRTAAPITGTQAFLIVPFISSLVLVVLGVITKALIVGDSDKFALGSLSWWALACRPRSPLPFLATSGGALLRARTGPVVRSCLMAWREVRQCSTADSPRTRGRHDADHGVLAWALLHNTCARDRHDAA